MKDYAMQIWSLASAFLVKLGLREVVDFAGDEEDQETMDVLCRLYLCVNFLWFLSHSLYINSPIHFVKILLLILYVFLYFFCVSPLSFSSITAKFLPQLSPLYCRFLPSFLCKFASFYRQPAAW